MTPVQSIGRTTAEELVLAWWLRIFTFLLLTGVAITAFVFAIVTALPESSASKDCLLGYRAHCTFTPISTIILLGLAGGLGYHVASKNGASVKRMLRDFVDRIAVEKRETGPPMS